MRYRTQVAFAIALGAAGCGSEEVFEPQLGSTERLVERAAVARIAGDDQFLAHVTVVGDIDGDGIDDAIVRSEYVIRDANFAMGSGVYVLYGGSGVTGKFAAASLPVLTGAGAPAGRIASVGDVDGDGLADFLVGIARVAGCGDPGVPKPGDPPEHGAAYLVYGSRTRLTGTTPTASVAALLRDATACTLGDGVAGLGDLDGDGNADFAISRSQIDGVGVAYLFYGRGARLTGTVDLAATADAVITTGLEYIAPLIRIGDVDGDGHGDFVVRAASDGLVEDVRLVRGRAERFTGTVALADIAQTQFTGGDFCHFIIADGAALGDLDGDGRDDFSLLSCHDVDQRGGFTVTQRVFYGRAGGFPAQIAAGEEDAAIPAASGVSEMASADVDGDGALDLILTETGARDGNGAVHVMYGDGRRLAGMVSVDQSLTYVGMTQRGMRCEYIWSPDCTTTEALGDELAVGDVTGDHKPDLLINAPTRQIVASELGVHGSAVGHVYVVSPEAPNP